MDPYRGSDGERLSGEGPPERFGESLVEEGDEGFDPGLEVILGDEAGSAQELSDQDREPDFDLVEPGRMPRCGVEGDAVVGIAQERLAAGLVRQYAGLALLAQRAQLD